MAHGTATHLVSSHSSVLRHSNYLLTGCITQSATGLASWNSRLAGFQLLLVIAKRRLPMSSEMRIPRFVRASA